MSDKIRKIGAINITDLDADGAQVKFPKNPAWIASFKAKFPKARWSPACMAWGIPGKLAATRAAQWADQIAAGDTVADRQRIIDAAAFDGVRSEFVTLTDRGVVVRTPYSTDVVAICRRLGGRWDADAKVWRIDAANLSAVVSAIPEIDRLAREAAAKIAALEAEARAERVERQHRYAAERAVRDADMATRRSHRHVVRAATAPSAGDVLRHYGQVVVVESLGKAFRADDDLSSMGGPIGAEGEMVRYAYWRPASADEIEAFEARETQAAERSRIARERREAIAAVAAGEIGPEIGHIPEGEEIWADLTSAATGYTTRIILSSDGWLWHVTTDQSDGAAWGVYNLGYCTVGRRIRTEPTIVAAIRRV